MIKISMYANPFWFDEVNSASIENVAKIIGSIVFDSTNVWLSYYDDTVTKYTVFDHVIEFDSKENLITITIKNSGKDATDANLYNSYRDVLLHRLNISNFQPIEFVCIAGTYKFAVISSVRTNDIEHGLFDTVLQARSFLKNIELSDLENANCITDRLILVHPDKKIIVSDNQRYKNVQNGYVYIRPIKNDVEPLQDTAETKEEPVDQSKPDETSEPKQKPAAKKRTTKKTT